MIREIILQIDILLPQALLAYGGSVEDAIAHCMRLAKDGKSFGTMGELVRAFQKTLGEARAHQEQIRRFINSSECKLLETPVKLQEVAEMYVDCLSYFS